MIVVSRFRSQRIFALERRDRMDGVGTADGLLSSLGKAEEADLPRAHQVRHGAHHFFDGYGPVDPMLVE
jgi:hypothetical protein